MGRNEKEEKVSETALVQCPEGRAAPAGRQMRALPHAGLAPLSAVRRAARRGFRFSIFLPLRLLFQPSPIIQVPHMADPPTPPPNKDGESVSGSNLDAQCPTRAPLLANSTISIRRGKHGQHPTLGRSCRASKSRGATSSLLGIPALFSSR